ncbi:MAG: BACON domain-containing protein, partial [Alistipes sp.]|nr:BACON domain-containing protein [Alistipes sp.]
MKKLFYLLLCLPLAIASCTPPQTEEPAPNGPDPVLILTSDDVISVKADGGQATVEYTLLNAKEGVESTAEYEAEWISNLTFGETITFDIAVNENAEPREAKMTFKYDVASMEVTVKQGGKKATPAIVINSEKEMEFGQDGGMGTIEYAIENPIQGVNVVAETNASWISQVTVQ